MSEVAAAVCGVAEKKEMIKIWDDTNVVIDFYRFLISFHFLSQRL